MPNLDIDNTFKRTSNTYRLVVMNDDTFDEVVAFRISRRSVYLGISISFILLVGLTIGIIAFTPLKYYIPGYGTKEKAEKTIKIINKLDKKDHKHAMAIATTMMNRAKYSANQTDDMKKAIPIFKEWIEKNKTS